MKPEHPLKSKMTAWVTGAAAGVVILLLGLSVKSLVVLLVAPPLPGAGRTESAAVKEQQDIATKNEGQTAQNQMPEPAALAQQAPDVTVDYRTLSEREAGRNEMTKTLREIAQDNPESGYALTAEQRNKLAQSGASFR